MANVRDWVDDRTGYRSILRVLLLLNFPVSRAARWRYVWGGSLALMLLVEVVTGTLLMTVYSPSEASAWGSVHYIDSQVGWGWFVRGVHHYTSHMMLVVILLHAVAVLLTAGYRRPKEFTYWSGLVLGGLVLALAISGNPLPWDQSGYWAYQIETGIIGTIPVVGSGLRTLLVGGNDFGNLTLTRLYTLHVAVLPVLAVMLLIVHVALMRREKLKLAMAMEQSNTAASAAMEPYWPYQTTRNLMMFVLLMAVVVGQSILYPSLKERNAAASPALWEQDLPGDEITLDAPADRDIPYVARPEWYVRFLYELRHMVGKERELLITAVLPLGLIVVLFAMPFVEKVLGVWIGHALAVLFVVCGLTCAAYLTYAGIRSDLRDPEFQLARRQERHYAGRAAWLAEHKGIPPEGPVSLLKNDAKAMGPLLFAAHCATCHRWDGHDGTGRRVMETVDGRKQEVAPTASDLANFGSEAWIAAFLADPRDERFFGAMHELEGGEDFQEGEMAAWADENSGPEGPLDKKHLLAVAALVAREAGRLDTSPPSDEVLKLGVAVFSGDEILGEDGEPLEFDGYCLQCHSLKAGDPYEEGAIGDAPDLNGYGSRQWLIDFIRDPGDGRFYSDKNLMPAFDDSRISDRDLGLLVDWMREEWDRADRAN